MNENTEKLINDGHFNNLSLRSPPVLMQATSIFPFNFYPDTITIKPYEVDLICRPTIGERWAHRVLIENITNVTVTAFVFIAHLEITDSTNPRNPVFIKVRNLSVDEAYQVEALIEGLIKLKNEQIDLYTLEPELLKKELTNQNILLNSKEKKQQIKKLTHYYGDTVRILYVISGIIMLLSLPFFHEIIPIHYSISVFSLLVIALISGLTNPESFMVIILDSIISILGFIIFEIIAITYLNENYFYSLVNQLLALIFFIATYFSTKTFRGYFSRF